MLAVPHLGHPELHRYLVSLHTLETALVLHYGALGRFPGGLVVRILGPGSIPDQGTEIPQAACCGKKKKTTTV